MKKAKRIFAGMAAAVMAFSTMSIGASAYPNTDNWPSFHLHYAYGAPSSDNVTTKTLYSYLNNGGDFKVTHAGQLTVDSYMTDLTSATASFQGWVYDPSVPNNWALVKTFTRSTLYFDEPRTGYYPNAYLNTKAKVVVNMNISSGSTYSNVQGKTIAY